MMRGFSPLRSSYLKHSLSSCGGEDAREMSGPQQGPVHFHALDRFFSLTVLVLPLRIPSQND